MKHDPIQAIRDRLNDEAGPEATEDQEIAAASLVKRIAALSLYGDGPDDLGDNDDAALVLNALIAEAGAVFPAIRDFSAPVIL